MMIVAAAVLLLPITAQPCLSETTTGRRIENPRPETSIMATADEVSMRAATLTMSGLRYEGVVQVSTAAGPRPRLRFSADSAKLSGVRGLMSTRTGHVALRADSLSLSGGVVVHVGRFSARLLGLIPLDFTPAAPPPLVLPTMSFTAVVLDDLHLEADTATMKKLVMRPLPRT
ncbi:hypothetical protein DFJ69_0607 [Thermomonospora umbrina]|uniref:Lipid/polyisoprenoid-binding YceI-like domain-containing protein n=2 Tax=Thermomonospora umbrina TaxID=111806 RepID=A0A3D9SRG9_9ACTN|nr:hypothetical protein DFJ69_0607 [Thermomonospora umbrina]